MSTDEHCVYCGNTDPDDVVERICIRCGTLYGCCSYSSVLIYCDPNLCDYCRYISTKDD